MIPEILTTLSSGIFAGAALYVNLVEHPARLSCGLELAVKGVEAQLQAGHPHAGSFSSDRLSPCVRRMVA
jgi:hypothetical protein